MNLTLVHETPVNYTVNKKLVKKMVGEAVNETDGVLDVKDRLVDIFKSDDDPTRGVSVSLKDGRDASLKVRVITEEGKSIPDVVTEATGKVVAALHNTAGIRAREVDIEVVDTRSIGDFLAGKYPRENIGY